MLHGSRLGLRTRFLAAWLVATHTSGSSARQPWKQLGPGRYKSAWPLVRKLRRAMADPGRGLLAGAVAVDETSPPFRAKDGPGPSGPSQPGRSREGGLLIAGAVEIRGKAPGRARLAVIRDHSADTLGGLVAGNIAEGRAASGVRRNIPGRHGNALPCR